MTDEPLVLICTKTCSTCRKAVALLDGAGASWVYREYTADPLTEAEIREILRKLGKSARDVLRARDAKAAGLTGDETDDALVRLMVGNPRLLQRPIGVRGERAVVGRPPEDLLTLLR